MVWSATPAIVALKENVLAFEAHARCWRSLGDLLGERPNVAIPPTQGARSLMTVSGTFLVVNAADRPRLGVRVA